MQQKQNKKLRFWILSVIFFLVASWGSTLFVSEFPPFTNTLKVIQSLEAKKPQEIMKRHEFYDVLKKIKKQKKSNLKNPKTKLKPLTREELIKTVCEVEQWKTAEVKKKPFPDIKTNDSLALCLAYAQEHTFLSFDTTKKLMKKKPVKRKEAVAFLKKVYGLKTPMKGAAEETPAKIETQKEKIEEPEEVAEAVVAAFSPVTPLFIQENFFEILGLNRPFPNTFYKNEVYFFEGEHTIGDFDQAFVFLMQDGKVIENFIDKVEDKKFKIPVIFLRPGNYQLGIILGASGRSKVADISVLENIGKADGMVADPKAPEKLSFRYKEGYTKLSWKLNDTGNFFRIRLSQGKREVMYFFRNPVAEFEPFSDNLSKFSPGPGAWQVETAHGYGQLPSLQVSSNWVATEPQEATFAEKAFRTLDENVVIEQFPEVLKTPTALIFKGKIGKAVEAKGVYTHPNGHVKSFLIQEGNPIKPIPPNTSLAISLPIQDQGTYIFELNDVDGGALVNVPVYVGENILPVIPDFFAIQTDALESDKPINLEEARKTLLALVNDIRKKAKLNEIVLDSALSKVAQGHTDDMISRNFFGHNNPDGKTPEDRRRAAKFPTPVRENLAKAPTIHYSHEGLLRSPIHRQAILGPEWTRVGIGITKDAEGYLIVAEEFSTDPFTTELLEKWKVEFMTDIHGARQHAGLKALNVNATLEKLAADWSFTMVQENFFAFESPGNEKLLTRARNSGIQNSLQAFIVQGAEKEKLVEELLKHPPLKDSVFQSLGFGMAADPEIGLLSITILYSH